MPLFMFFRENVSLSTKTLRSNVDKSYLETSFPTLICLLFWRRAMINDVYTKFIPFTLTVAKAIENVAVGLNPVQKLCLLSFALVV